MASVFESVPVARITEQARAVNVGRAALTSLAALLFAVGWLAAKTFAVLALALVWCAVAVKIGWQEARGSGGARGPAR